MPAIPVYPPSQNGSFRGDRILPHTLMTPSGLAIVEIQGTIKLNTSARSAQNGASDTPSIPVGKLVIPDYDSTKSADDTSWQKRVYLYIGQHQRLTGEVKKLSKPLAVLRKRPDAGEPDALEIAEIVYYKLLFAHRPEPVGGVSGE